MVSTYKPRQPVFMMILSHRTIRDTKYTMTDFGKAYVIFSHDFSENINRGTDREGDTKYFFSSTVDVNKDQFVLNALH